MYGYNVDQIIYNNIVRICYNYGYNVWVII